MSLARGDKIVFTLCFEPNSIFQLLIYNIFYHIVTKSHDYALWPWRSLFAETMVSPWYNLHGWLGVKNQIIIYIIYIYIDTGRWPSSVNHSFVLSFFLSLSPPYYLVLHRTHYPLPTPLARVSLLSDVGRGWVVFEVADLLKIPLFVPGCWVFCFQSRLRV